MRRLKFFAVLTIVALSATAQKKAIYIPEDLKGMNLQSYTSKWSFKRSMETDDLIFMWERGFDAEPKDGIVSGPDLDGKPMRFSLTNLRDRVQAFYHFFRDTLAFVQTPSGYPYSGGEKVS